MTHVVVKNSDEFEYSYPVIVIGGGGTGLCAALAVRDGGQDVLILEQDKTLLGTTSMSTGLIPASGTQDQKAQGIDAVSYTHLTLPTKA